MLNALAVIRQCPLSLLIKNLLEKYTEIWKRINSLKKVKSDSEPVYGDNDKQIKTKTKLYGDKTN